VDGAGTLQYLRGRRRRLRHAGDDAGGLGLEREEAGAEFVVEFLGDVLALALAQRDQLVAEHPVVFQRVIERTRQAIELLADRRELGDADGRDADGEIALLEMLESARQNADRTQGAADHPVDRDD